ncbi:MAG: cysteine--tRNA ligase, partial [Mycoplasmatota bacterium]|nr:cysteine--tRNA ligase [Mycoplasmatota bacterium]
LNDETGKMSKSKGEFLTANLLINKGYNPLDYRYFCLNSHYRNSLVFSYDSLDTSRKAFNKLRSKVALLVRTGEVNQEKFNTYKEKFKEAFSNDINTAQMLTVVYDVLKDNELNDVTKFKLIEDFDTVLSLDLTKKEEVKIESALEEDIKKKIEERSEAKKARNFAKADAIRDELLSNGIKLIDTREGTTYEVM